MWYFPFYLLLPLLVLTTYTKYYTPSNQQSGQDTQEPEKVIYVYPLEGGGVVFTETPVEDDQPDTPIVDITTPTTDTRPTARREAPLFLHYLLLLFLFTALDNVDSFFTLLTPTVTVTITPIVKTISTTATITAGGAGADIHARRLAPLTLSQEQTINATGHGHQNATQATGSLVYFNGSFSSHTIDAGTVYTGADGVQVVTDQTVTIPAANPPYLGQATVAAHARLAGASGNIPAGDISITGNTVQVRNTQFTNGVDARDFTYVRKADIQAVVSTLTPQLMQSEQAALTAQLTTGESIVTPTCTPKTTPNHAPGDEAQSVTVVVSETCSSLAYNPKALQTAGTKILAAHNAVSLLHFQQVGEMHLSILSQTLHDQRATLTLQLASTWVYHINTGHLTALILGKSRRDALHLLAETPGVKDVTIAGVKDNEQLPSDPAHIHLNIFYLVS